VESIPSRRRVSFAVLQTRLIRFINMRIQNGDFTERGLARILGISQSQVHNVLKGARKLKPELADALMRKFEMSVLDLLDPFELQDQTLVRHGTSNPPPKHGAEPAAHVPLSKLHDLKMKISTTAAPEGPFPSQLKTG
jgi:hypothetical protein